MEALTPQYNQSRSLIAEADRRWVMPAEWISRFITVKPEIVAVDVAQRMVAIAAQRIGRVPEVAPTQGPDGIGSPVRPSQHEPARGR